MDELADQIAGLVRRARAGDPNAFAALIEPMERRCLAIAHAVVGCPQSAADVVQEAFIRAWQKLTDLKEPARFPAWLCRMTQNLALDATRRHRPTIGPEHLQRFPGRQRNDPLLETEESARLEAAIRQLDDLTRIILALRYYENCTSREIGELVGLSASAVDMRLSRGRMELRGALTDAAERDTIRGGVS